MHKLPDTAPAVYQAFMAGKFVVKKMHGKLNAVQELIWSRPSVGRKRVHLDGWMNGVLGHFYALSRLNWAGDNLG